jgi:CubicO group peptidase (beta-lactamase class C family)
LVSTTEPAPTWQKLDLVLQQAVERGELPGAVVLVLHRGRIVYRKAHGLRAKAPAAEPMTIDTVFDLASLTKPIATATSIMLLRERGKPQLTDRVAAHWPEFGRHGKDKITIEQVLLHTSGLIADNPEADYRDGKERALERICDLHLVADPGTRFIYSDVGYIVLGELVKRISGCPLDEFAGKNIFAPLGMKETAFRPNDLLRKRCAPTEQRDGGWIRGEVHDPRAHRLGGVAGHAGLFSTADDLASYAQMILGGKSVLSKASIQVMTEARAVPSGLRAYGWDVETRYSSNRGDVFTRGASYGHTGFTGTSIWIDPASQTAVIFLSNRVHPIAKNNINRLRGEVATLAGKACNEIDQIKPFGPCQSDPLPPLNLLHRHRSYWCR